MKITPQGGAMNRILIALLAIGLLAGCTSSSGGHAKKYKTSLGQDAATIATHVPGCSAVQAETKDDLLPSASSGATCRISGHKATIFGWSTAKANAQPISNLNGAAYFARGTGWSAIVDDAVSGPTAKSISQQFVTALGGKVVAS